MLFQQVTFFYYVALCHREQFLSSWMADPVLHHSPPSSAPPPAPAPAGPAAALGRGALRPQGLDALGAAGGEVGVGVEVGAVEVLVVVGDGEALPDRQPAGPDGGVPAENVQSPAPCTRNQICNISYCVW